MRIELPISFPTESSRVARQVELERGWTATQRIAAVAESLTVVREFARAGGSAPNSSPISERLRQQWLQRMVRIHRPADSTCRLCNRPLMIYAWF